MSFYTFNQNNSGGDFDFNKEHGITHYVIIEANNVGQAKALFNGITDDYPDKGYDCSCCGERWSDFLWDDDGEDEPKIYDKVVTPGVPWYGTYRNWLQDGENVAIHYLDGRIVFV